MRESEAQIHFLPSLSKAPSILPKLGIGNQEKGKVVKNASVNSLHLQKTLSKPVCVCAC